LRRLFPLALCLLLAAFASSAAATEVRTPGGPPNLVVQVPDSAVVSQVGGQMVIVLAPDTLPILNMGMLVFDPAKIDLTSPDVYPVLATDVLNNIAQSAGGSVRSQAASSRVFIAGKPGYLYRSIIENQGGGDMSVEVALLMLDKAHIGLFALVSVQGKESIGGLENAMRAATLATQ
jgi:hypothetical protein